MSIRFPCSCGTTVTAQDNAVGEITQCPRCRTDLRVPHPQDTNRQKIDNNDLDLSSGAHLFHPPGTPENADFFVPAPKEIGPLRSAHTSLRKTTRPKSLGLRLFIGIAIGVGIAAAVAIGLYFGARLPLDASGVLFGFIALIVTPVMIGLALYFTRFRHYCGYVGENGIAHFTCAGSREKLKIRETFLFDDADDLRVESTHYYHNGAYNGTKYAYSWSDESGKNVYVLRDTHHHERRMPPPHDKVVFAQSAEEAWSYHLLGRALPELDAGRTITFRLSRNNKILLQKDSLELHLNGKVQHFAADDLAEARVKDGTITLKEPGAKEG